MLNIMKSPVHKIKKIYRILKTSLDHLPEDLVDCTDKNIISITDLNPFLKDKKHIKYYKYLKME